VNVMATAAHPKSAKPFAIVTGASTGIGYYLG
jgi:short-subunit dehydrogenase